MRKLSLLFILMIVTFQANAIGPKYRDFLVENQPMPSGIYLKQDILSTKTNLNMENDRNTLTMYHKHTAIDASPFFITNRSRSFSVLGVGYTRDQFASLNSSEISNYYSGVYGSLYAISEINSNWYWNAYVSYGVFSEGNVNASKKSDKRFSFATIAYKRNTKQIYKLGILHNSNFGEDIILPVLGLSYSRSSYVLDALLPAYVSVRKIHSNKWHSIVKTAFSYASYYDHNKNDILEMSGIDTSITTEYNIYPYIWWNMSIAYATEKQLTWANSSDDFATINGGFKLSSGVDVRF